MPVIRTPHDVAVSFQVAGSGPPLVLVHGSFSDETTNWCFVRDLLARHFTVCAVARRGRGATDATAGHSVEDEAADVAAVIASLAEPVFLLGHSYGALCSLHAAAAVNTIRKLVLYEPPGPNVVSPPARATLEAFAAQGDWDGFATSFFHRQLRVPVAEIEALRSTPHWQPILDDAPASLHDLRALSRHRFEVAAFRSLSCPVLLQVGSESPSDLFLTASLAARLPDSRIEVLDGQAHEGMTTAPEQYAESVIRFLTAQ